MHTLNVDRPGSTRRTPARPSPWLTADVLAAGALFVLLVFAVWHRDWARFSDKAMLARAVTYPVAVLLVPAGWAVVATRRRRSARPVPAFPALAALLVTLPFLIDVAGNALDLYDRVDVFDDVCHYLNWLLLCSAVGVSLSAQARLPRWAVAALCTGFGAVTAIGWELAEYTTFVTHTPEQFTIYRDTMGDLALGLTGSLTAGLLCASASARLSRRGRRPSRA